MACNYRKMANKWPENCLVSAEMGLASSETRGVFGETWFINGKMRLAYLIELCKNSNLKLKVWHRS